MSGVVPTEDGLLVRRRWKDDGVLVPYDELVDVTLGPSPFRGSSVSYLVVRSTRLGPLRSRDSTARLPQVGQRKALQTRAAHLSSLRTGPPA